MINRRNFLMTLAAQPLVLNSIIQSSQPIHTFSSFSDVENSECIVVAGWTLMKSDLLDAES